MKDLAGGKEEEEIVCRRYKQHQDGKEGEGDADAVSEY